jgi:hypothetical protein
VRGVCFLVLALNAAVLNGQQPVPPRQQEIPKAEACTIEGQVVSATTGEALRKATVLLNQLGKVQGERYTTTTTAGGRFALQDVEPGRYQLQAAKSGYAQMQYGATASARAGTTLSLDPGQHLHDITFRLVPQGVITGRVVDEDGEPVAYVSIQVLRYRYWAGKRQLQPAGYGTTNDLGEYRIFGLAPGRYYLHANPQSDADVPYQGGGWQTYAPTYYPGTNDPTGAAALELSAGARLRGIDFTLLKTRSVRLRGKAVLAGTGSPLQGEELRLTPREESRAAFSRSDFWSFTGPEGAFQFRGVIPGGYFVQAQWSEDGKSYAARQPIDVRENDVSNMVIELSPGAELKGQLRVEGRPLASLSDVRISLQPDTSSPFMGGAGGSVKRDGSLTLANIGLDHYRLNVYGIPEDYYIKSALCGDKNVLESGLDFSHGVSGALEIVLSSKGGQAEGVVLNAAERPVTGAMVVAVPDAPRRAQAHLYKEGTTDQYGRFAIKGIAPGGYKLFAWEELESGASQDSEFLKTFEAQGQPIAIQESRAESAQLKLIPTEAKKTPPANPSR